MAQLDAIDLHLLTLLQASGRVPQNELAHSVGLSAPAVADRLRKLEERGVIRQYTVIVDPESLGLEVAAYVTVAINGSRYYPAFAQRVAEAPEILECHSVTGEGSHLLKIRTMSTSTLERLLATVQSWPGVHGTSTSVVLSTIKELPGSPLAELARELTRPREGKEEQVDSTGFLHVPFRHQP